ncbi:cadherin-related family member 5 [Salarias fasciatus]|uniref:cadherin-related family member 5 n=1 Tax=Salarias fasciatus TaxID=181472 RepID=UPI0011768886|nr:cadherin-related family member 5-like [Salarias fasciatus]
MAAIGVIALSILISTALSAPVKVNEENLTLFHGEDFHILLPSLNVEVTFQNKSTGLILMRDGAVVSSRVKLNRHLSHLVVDNVREEDEGTYTVKNQEKPDDVKRIFLIVRDCTNEQIVKYGSNFRLSLSGITRPITLEYKSSAVEANQTSRPALVVLTATETSPEPYQGRITINDQYVTLHGVTGSDEGSYTIWNGKGDIQKKECLNVKEHHNFVTLPQDARLKINLILNSSLVQLYYRPKSESTPHLLLDKGEFTNARIDLGLEDRLSLDGSVVYLDQVKRADVGEFKITDLQGFTVSNVHLELEPYRLESLYVAIIALLGLLVFLLLVCLLSCLIKVKKRAKRAAALEKIAQNAGKEDEGEAFRQVVKNITKLSEESKHSQADNTEKSQSTEVDIKGLEVSSKEVGIGNMETSDSGVGFNTALPLDTDTDAPDQIPDSEAVSISAATEPKPSPPPAAAAAADAAADSQPSAPPATETKPSPKKTPDKPVEAKLDVPKPAEVKLSPAPSPEPKSGLSPAEPKAPAPTPSPEPKPATPKATTPTPEIKSSLTPTAESPKPTTPEPITNGTPEPGLDSKASPDHAEIIGGSTPKAAPPKTPEVELKSSGAALEASKDITVAEDSTSAT